MASLCGHEWWCVAVGARDIDVAPSIDEVYEKLRVAALCGHECWGAAVSTRGSTLYPASMRS